MSKDSNNKPKDLNDVEMLIAPSSPKNQPDIHLVTNERRQGREKHPNHPNTNSESDVETVATQPLLEPDKKKQKPPLAGPEVDDLDDDPVDNTPFPGIDDGLLEPESKKPDKPEDHDDEDPGQKPTENGHPTGDEHTNEGNWWHKDGVDEADYPYDGINGFGGPFDDRPGSPMYPGTSIPDVNTYQQKKNLAQGMMDLALLSANANQLRYVLESSERHPYYYPSLVFISFSILLQIGVGVGLIMNSRYNVKDEKDICKADKINNMTVLGVFLITIVNVFITSFSVATPNTVATAGQQSG
ncbi:uncharacterized protein LOC113239657 isoform X2 [Hyposmocoma kahamanoa]|uniref:uncharacterized protein LOC113239657 isoform X2 n=1 Tax=Hyposmocoma kahamanoa TaxID=1477025 RepID=UPI000E6D7051|nr:uncharacterized protein LOC113239657 isoform X2 [Hyposmocoma kahamanoa]